MSKPRRRTCRASDATGWEEIVSSHLVQSLPSLPVRESARKVYIDTPPSDRLADQRCSQSVAANGSQLGPATSRIRLSEGGAGSLSSETDAYAFPAPFDRASASSLDRSTIQADVPTSSARSQSKASEVLDDNRQAGMVVRRTTFHGTPEQRTGTPRPAE